MGLLETLDPLPRDAKRIRDIPIRDIYISRKDGKIDVKGLAADKVTRMPNEYIDDFTHLWANIVDNAPNDRNEFFIEYNDLIYRISRIDSVDGVSYHIRQPLQQAPDLEDLRIPETLCATIRSLGTRAGLILLGGKPGSGKTTLLYACIKAWLIKHGGIAYILEDPFPEILMAGSYTDPSSGARGRCYQEAVENGDYAPRFRHVLRVAPDIIGIGEIRDGATASLALKAAISGHVVIATIHAEDKLGCLRRITTLADSNNNDPPRPLLAAGLLAFSHQTLAFNPTRTIPDLVTIPPDSSTPIRSIVRDGQLEHLSSYIDRQSAANHTLPT